MKNEKLYKALCQLLPHGVKVFHDGWNQFTPPVLIGIAKLKDSCDVLLKYGSTPLSFVKPYLRPLSDLTKEIEHEGNTCRLIELMVKQCEYYCDPYDEWMESFVDNPCVTRIVQAPWEVVDECIKRKIDIWDLIESGDAIAVTEDNNPYK